MPRLEVRPESITLATPGDEAYFWVYLDGRPALEVTLDIAGSYDRFFRFTTVADDPGVHLVQTMADSSEYGAYTLLVKAGGLEKQVPIRIGTAQDLAPDKAVTHAPLRLLRIALPEQVYTGQQLTLPADLGPGTRWYHWRVNGEPVLEGTGADHLRYLADQPGPVYFSVVVREGGRQVARWEGRTQVVPYPPIAMEATAGQDYRFQCPEGYAACAWTVNGQPAGSGMSFDHRFAVPGSYTLECHASEPTDPSRAPLYRRAWTVTVR
jgi:hypothetical protein